MPNHNRVPDHRFNAPIPGQSLTKAPGSTPWQQPPKFAKLDDALNYIFDRLTQQPILLQVMTFLKHGVPLEVLARMIIFPGFATGMWTPNLGLLMAKPVMYMLAGIAQRAGLNPKITHTDRSGLKDMVGFKVMTMTNQNLLPEIHKPLVDKALEQNAAPKPRGLMSPPVGSNM